MLTRTGPTSGSQLWSDQLLLRLLLRLLVSTLANFVGNLRDKCVHLASAISRPVCVAKCKYSHGLTVPVRVRGGLNLDPQFMGKAQELLGASRAFNTMKVTKSALAKVTQAELLFGIDLSFPWSLSDAANFVMACIELQLKANTIRWDLYI